MTDVRIYVASLSDYNNAILHGVWIDIEESTTYDEVWEQVEGMLKDSPAARKYGDVAEEFAIHDSEGFGGYQVHEYAWLPDVVEIGAAIAGHSNPDALKAWMGICGEDDPRKAIDSFDDAFEGEHQKPEHFAMDWAVETGEIEEDSPWFNYIDWAEYWRSMFDNAGWHAEYVPGGSYYIFSPV
jgi:antirestriction protein